MSRIGKKPIALPAGVTLTRDGRMLTVTGPKGAVTKQVPPLVEINVEEGKQVLVTKSESRDKRARCMWGLTRTLIANMVQGVVEQYSKTLLIEGTGYKAEWISPLINQGGKDVEDGTKPKGLTLTLGYAHKIRYETPVGITIQVVKPTEILITGVDKEQVGKVAAEIRRFRRPEVYKGKGIRYAGEVIVKKVGKSGSK